MRKFRSPVLSSLTIVAALVVLTTSGCAAWRLKQSLELARQSQPWQASPVPASATLLIVGDSTAVGTGASAPQASLAGLISREHPQVQIVNRAKDGARFADIARQLEGDERFDVIVVLGGGNDVIRLTGREELQAGIERTAQLARARADTVILMPSGNVGNAPFFFAPWSWLMTQRSKNLHQLVRSAAASSGAIYVKLYQDKAADPFAQEPGRLHARDGLHPSDAGYELWYRELDAQAGLAKKLTSLKR